jgi:hypothetical protein
MNAAAAGCRKQVKENTPMDRLISEKWPPTEAALLERDANAV